MSSTVRLYLVRHGHVEEPWPSRIYGDLDVPLSEQGRALSRAIAERFQEHRIDRVVSSGLERTEYAAQLLREHRPCGHPVLVRTDDPRLRELHRGAWAGFGEAELERQVPGAWRDFWDRQGLVIPPGGETLEDLTARVLPALDEQVASTVRDAENAAISGPPALVVVAHKWVLRVAACATLELPLERCTRIEVPPGGLAVLDWPADGLAPERSAQLIGIGPGQLP